MNNQTFAFELEAIHNTDVRDQVSALLDIAPAYFWHVAASSSGKYHPAYALGESGLVRHVKAAVRFGIELAPIKGFSELEVDYALAALILHDICKQGRNDEGEHTVFEHPLLAAQFIEENAAPWFSSIVCPLVASHMGQWNTSKYSTAQLPVPVTPLEQFVHECDYLASRKCFDVELV